MTSHREAVFIATLIGVVAVTGSLGVALLLNVGGDPPVGQATGAAWAWAIGVASEKFWFPWVKHAVSVAGEVAG